VFNSFTASPLVQKPAGAFASFTVSSIPDHQRYDHIQGKASISGGAKPLFLGVGLSFACLTFKAADWREHIVQETSDIWPAHDCDKCGAVTVETTRVGSSVLENYRMSKPPEPAAVAAFRSTVAVQVMSRRRLSLLR
jgi:hypothetical protein